MCFKFFLIFKKKNCAFHGILKDRMKLHFNQPQVGVLHIFGQKARRMHCHLVRLNNNRTTDSDQTLQLAHNPSI